MYEVARLPDDFYLEEELTNWYIQILQGQLTVDKSNKKFYVYKIKNSKVAFILPVNIGLDSDEVVKAARHIWQLNIELVYMSKEYSSEQSSNILAILSEYKYIPKKQKPFAYYFFNWQKWFKNLILEGE